MTLSKRLFDISFALLLSLVLAPGILVLIVYLLLKQGRPLFYVSERMKTPTHAFQLWKFRTMTVVAQDAGVSGGDKAARVTEMGLWLRARHFDELPQLWNILKGDLSFVGPRPPLRAYVERAPALYAQVLKARPGVTGLATQAFRAHEERLLARCTTPAETDATYARRCIPRKARLDLIYLRHRSVCYDLALIRETVAAVFRRPDH
jgi:lipopolysaccharide/colanic/teichoic acid biosynthesis glycosyltransferase